jgi:hypothetical protein
MDSPIAPSAMRRSEDGPAYDLISLGLVVFTILLVGIWVSRFFHEPADDDFGRAVMQFDMDPSLSNKDPADNLSAAGNLSAAQWADFHLHTPGGAPSKEFRKHMKLALEQEQAVQADIQVRSRSKDPAIHNEAEAELSENYRGGKGPARAYFDAWLANRIVWLDENDRRKFDRDAHSDMARFLVDLGMRELAVDELEKIFMSRPDLQNRAKADLENLLIEFQYSRKTAAELSEIIQVREHRSDIK